MAKGMLIPGWSSGFQSWEAFVLTPGGAGVTELLTQSTGPPKTQALTGLSDIFQIHLVLAMMFPLLLRAPRLGCRGCVCVSEAKY